MEAQYDMAGEIYPRVGPTVIYWVEIKPGTRPQEGGPYLFGFVLNASDGPICMINLSYFGKTH